MKKKEIPYGFPIKRDDLPKPTKRLPQYDECLTKFLKSESELWKVNLDALPSQDIRIVISALKWRINHREGFGNIQVFMRRNSVYLEKVGVNE